MSGFIKFIREQGVIGLAIGVIIGTSIGKVITSLVQDLIQPIIGLVFGFADGLKAWKLGPVAIGNFIGTTLDFIIVAAVVYYVIRGFKLDRLDEPKETKV